MCATVNGWRHHVTSSCFINQSINQSIIHRHACDVHFRKTKYESASRHHPFISILAPHCIMQAIKTKDNKCIIILWTLCHSFKDNHHIRHWWTPNIGDDWFARRPPSAGSLDELQSEAKDDRNSDSFKNQIAWFWLVAVYIRVLLALESDIVISVWIKNSYIIIFHHCAFWVN